MTSVPRRRADRVAGILQCLTDEHSVDAAALAAKFDVSPATMRRDLQMLADQRLLVRTHGGARAYDVASELPLRYRGTTRRDEKLAIAAAAAELLPKGLLVLGLSGGTTASEFARVIASRVDLTVVTTALNIAAELALRPRLKVIMTGGVARPQSYEVVGPFAEQTLQALHLEVAVVGVDGITAQDGLTTHDEIEAHTNRTLISRARRVIVIADGSKVGRVLLAQMCPLDAVHDFVTDDTADPETLDQLRAAGVAVHVVHAHPEATDPADG